MTGEILAVISAGFYGLGGVAIARGSRSARGDNGVFLSVLVTAVTTGVIWLFRGAFSFDAVLTPDGATGVLFFAVAGLFSTVLGRVAMYRAVGLVGAVTASFHRRLIPVFAIGCAFTMLGEVPDLQMVVGGLVIFIGVVSYSGGCAGMRWGGLGPGQMMGIGSALFYAIAYGLRRLGLEDVPDPVFGTFLGAIVGLIWIGASSFAHRSPRAALCHLLVDRGNWHWLAAIALSAGQLLQFFALQSAKVSSVAILGSLDVVFSTVLATLVFRTETIPKARFLLASGLSLIGTAIVFQ